MSIDPRAIVDPDARIAAGVKVGPFAVIGAGVEIGPGCEIGAHAVIEGPTRIGRDNRILGFASLGIPPQDKGYRGEPTRLEIGDRALELRVLERQLRGRGIGLQLQDVQTPGREDQLVGDEVQ